MYLFEITEALWYLQEHKEMENSLITVIYSTCIVFISKNNSASYMFQICTISESIMY